MSPSRVIAMVKKMRDELIKIDPSNQDFYRENAQNYMEEIKNTDEEIRDILSDLENRSFLIYHPALGYFADEYDLNMIPVQKEGKEASARRLQQIIDLSEEKELKDFYQKLADWERQHYEDVLEIEKEAEKEYWIKNRFTPF